LLTVDILAENIESQRQQSITAKLNQSE